MRQASGPQLRDLAAQLVWTLSQDSQITAVRLLADSSPLNVPGAPAVQTRATWADLNPAPAVDLPGFFTRSDTWRSTIGGSNPSLQSAGGLSHLAMTADGRILAAIDSGPRRARLLTWHSGGRPETRLSAAVQWWWKGALVAALLTRLSDSQAARHARIRSYQMGVCGW